MGTTTPRALWMTDEKTRVAHRFESRHVFLNEGERPPMCGLPEGPDTTWRDPKPEDRRCSACKRSKPS